MTAGANSGDVRRVRAFVAALWLCWFCSSPARAVEPPRWKLQASLIQGFGGSYDQGSVAGFPTTLSLGIRIWGPLSIVAGGTGVMSSDTWTTCGEPRRAYAILAHAGLRFDFNNKKGDSWLDPFIEVHGGVGGQPGGRESPGSCPRDVVFGSGGVRAGLDVWLGRAAVTVAVGFDWVPIAPPAAAFLGATFLIQ